jgi:hypothetical protein
MLGLGHVAQALRGDGADGGERILDAVVEFFQDQLLQLVGRLALLGVDAGLGEQFLRVDLGLGQSSSRRLTFSAAKKSWGGGVGALVPWRSE